MVNRIKAKKKLLEEELKLVTKLIGVVNSKEEYEQLLQDKKDILRELEAYNK